MYDKAPEVGELARDFTLPDHRGEEFPLSKYRGKVVLLSFHPLAWTNICALQMQSLENSREQMEELDAVAVGVSIDSVPSKMAWAKELEIEDTPLLCDFWPHGGMAKDYGIFREEDGFSERANILVNPEGEIAFVKVYPIRELPDMDEIIDEIKKMRGE
ncbi:MAG: redoxin domain-containing protein [Thermoplasmata archaeon]